MVPPLLNSLWPIERITLLPKKKKKKEKQNKKRKGDSNK